MSSSPPFWSSLSFLYLVPPPIFMNTSCSSKNVSVFQWTEQSIFSKGLVFSEPSLLYLHPPPIYIYISIMSSSPPFWSSLSFLYLLPPPIFMNTSCSSKNVSVFQWTKQRGQSKVKEQSEKDMLCNLTGVGWSHDSSIGLKKDCHSPKPL